MFFSTSKLTFLGHTVSSSGLQLDPREMHGYHRNANPRQSDGTSKISRNDQLCRKLHSWFIPTDCSSPTFTWKWKRVGSEIDLMTKQRQLTFFGGGGGGGSWGINFSKILEFSLHRKFSRKKIEKGPKFSFVLFCFVLI